MKKTYSNKNKRIVNRFDTAGEMSTAGVTVTQPTYANAGDYLNRNPPQVLNNGNTNKFNLGNALSGLGGVADMIGSAAEIANIADTSGTTSTIKFRNNSPVNATSNEDVMNAFANYNNMDPLTYRQVRGMDGKQVAGRIGVTALKGAGASNSIGGMFGTGAGAAGAAIGAIVGGLFGGVGAVVGKNKAIRKQNILNKNINQSNFLKKNALSVAASNVDTMNDRALLSNYSFAQGGPLSKGITSSAQYAKRYQPAVLFADGGLMHTHGALFDNGMQYFNNGGTHEQNPNEGVQIGVDPQGVPNLVEEGEVMYDDYVFSNRLTVPKSTKKDLKLKNKKNMKFADAAKDIAKESEERPNDPISKRGMEEMLGRLAESQEEVRFKEQMKDPEFLQQAMMAMQQAMQQQVQGQEQPMSPEEQTAIEQQSAMEQQYGAQEAGMEQPQMSPEEEQMLMQQMQQGGIPYACGGKVNKYSGGGKLSASEKKDVKNFIESLKEHPDTYDNLLRLGLSSFTSKDKLENSDIELIADILRRNNYSLKGVNLRIDPTADDIIEEEVIPIPQNMSSGGLDIDKIIAEDEERRRLEESAINKQLNKLKQDYIAEKGYLSTKARYAPIIGSALAMARDMFQTPDYSRAAAIEKSATPVQGVSFSPVGGYLPYNPVDINYLANQISAQGAAGRNAIINNSNGNRATAVSGILANDYNNQIAIGANMLAAQNANLEQRQKIAAHNLGIDQYNSKGAVDAAAQNANIAAANRNAYMEAIKQGSLLREQIDNGYSAAKSANETNFYNNLGNYGKDNLTYNQYLYAMNHGVFPGANPQEYASATGKRAKGGKINRKKEKGLTF